MIKYSSFVVVFTDKPGAPEELSVSDITAESCTLHWQPPKDNGGSDIRDYIIEKREANRRSWNKIGTTSDLEFVVPKLIEKNQYVFRVFAENEVGVGEATELKEAVTAKNTFGKFHSLYLDHGIISIFRQH